MRKVAHKVDLQEPVTGRPRFLCGVSVHGTTDHIALSNVNVTCPKCLEILGGNEPQKPLDKRRRVGARPDAPRKRGAKLPVYKPV